MQAPQFLAVLHITSYNDSTEVSDSSKHCYLNNKKSALFMLAFSNKSLTLGHIRIHQMSTTTSLHVGYIHKSSVNRAL